MLVVQCTLDELETPNSDLRQCLRDLNTPVCIIVSNISIISEMASDAYLLCFNFLIGFIDSMFSIKSSTK